MTDDAEDAIERRLREAFSAQAHASVGDTAPPPAPRFATGTATPGPHRRARLLAPLAAAAAVVAVVGGIVAVADRSAPSGRGRDVAGGSTTSTPAPAAKSGPTSVPNPAATIGGGAPARSVHIKLFNADGAEYGVGMPVIAVFSGRITDARPLAAATTVTVNGKPLQADWYFARSPAGLGAVEGHLRPHDYWPAHAKVHVGLATQGVSAGRGITFDDTLTLDFTTGPRTVAEVDDASHTMRVTSDSKPVGTFPVSLGSQRTPTMHGIKVIMEKNMDVKISGPGYSDPHVKYAQRLTYDGEYLHAAPWNVANINGGRDTSNGCTNLLPTSAALLYKMLRVGDVVTYPDAPGPAMSIASGFGDWNVPWSTWRTGGLVPTS